MKAYITRSFGSYVLKFRSDDLQELRQIANIVEGLTGLKIKDVVY